MNIKFWEKTRLELEKQALWELYHENSKISQYDNSSLSKQEMIEKLNKMDEVLSYDTSPRIPLPDILPLKGRIDEMFKNRISVREMIPKTLTLAEVSTLLFYSYGVTRDNKGKNISRSFRIVPSGGALYPLELYIYSTHIEGIDSGFYHYNPIKSELRQVFIGNFDEVLSKAIIQNQFVSDSSLLVFITAIFERSIFKYRERGYRLILLEAGHVSQNLALVSNVLNLGHLCIAGFYDRQIDEILDIDGVTHSTLYINAIGGIQVNE
jgi:SagB-type dehydrogenase family enzyme